MEWNLFYIGQLLLVMGPALDTASEKLIFPFPRMYQLQIVSWLGVGTSILPHLHCQCWDAFLV